jgi:type IV pilus assembly protein PilX
MIFSLKHQSGVVLPISMIMLLLLTLISITSAQVSGFEEKMAGNSKDSNLAFQAAEASLRVGEAATAGTPTLFTGTSPFYTGASTTDWTDAAVTTYNGGTLTGVSESPRYTIEDLGSADTTGACSPCEAGAPPPSSGSRRYRITARGTGGTANAVAVLQSTFAR